MSIFAGKTLMITGGTGSFGNAVLRRFLDSDIKTRRNRTICATNIRLSILMWQIK